MPPHNGHWPAQSATAAALERVGDWFSRLRGRARDDDVEPPHANGLIVDPADAMPSPPPRVSVIVLNRDGAALLERLFASVQRVNTYANIDIVLVDHASGDASVTVAERWAKILPLTVVRCDRNYSFAYSCNRAAERAAGEFLMLLNNDVVLTEDAIGRLVAAAARHRGMAGCRLTTPDGAVCHIGVRFRWRKQRGFATPYNATPRPGDERLARAPSRFLAVTSAVALCRRDDFLAAGGFAEDYVYGYEDVDLCLKLALRQGRTNVALNDIAAIHDEGTTRRTKIAPADHRRWFDNNVAVLNRRFGYAMRRTLLPLIFSDDGSQSGRRARVGIVAGRHAAPMAALAAGFAGWSVQRRVGRDLAGLDLLIVADPEFRPARVRHRPPMMVRVAWILDDARAWARHDLTAYDLAIDATDPAASENFRAALRTYLSDKHRFSIKLQAQGGDAFAAMLAAALRRAGHHVRLDRPDAWRCPDAMRDDVAILMPGEPVCLPDTDKIVIALAASDMAMADPDAFAATLPASIDKLHRERMQGPVDPPLAPRAPFNRPVVAGWE